MLVMGVLPRVLTLTEPGKGLDPDVSDLQEDQDTGVFGGSSIVVDSFPVCRPGELMEVPKDTETLGLFNKVLYRK